MAIRDILTWTKNTPLYQLSYSPHLFCYCREDGLEPPTYVPQA